MNSFKKFLLEFETTLRYHDDLNQAVWDGQVLLPEVRRQLLKIAEAWRDFSNIPKSAVKDVLLTGGNANFNYTKYSDLDIHLLIDKNKLPDCDVEVMDDYLKDKKALWAFNHDIKIHGLPVELYAQGTTEYASSDQGVFSLLKNEWVRKPKKEKVNLNDPYIAKKVKHFMHMIDSMVDGRSDDIDKMDAFKERLRNMRGAAIKAGGEFSIENLVFKELRNKGYLDKLTDYIKNVEDKKLSL